MILFSERNLRRSVKADNLRYDVNYSGFVPVPVLISLDTRGGGWLSLQKLSRKGRVMCAVR